MSYCGFLTGNTQCNLGVGCDGAGVCCAAACGEPDMCCKPPGTALPRLVGITGPKRSGKDTAARYLSARHRFVQHSFAGPIRKFVADILGWSLEELEERKEQPVDWLDGATPRSMMQTAGTEWGRSMVHPELWVRSCLQRAQRDALAGTPVVISDVRFDNEAEAIRALGGQVWKLHRPAAEGSGDTHVSEIAISPHLIDRVIGNAGSVRDLIVVVENALAS